MTQQAAAIINANALTAMIVLTACQRRLAATADWKHSRFVIKLSVLVAILVVRPAPLVLRRMASAAAFATALTAISRLSAAALAMIIAG